MDVDNWTRANYHSWRSTPGHNRSSTTRVDLGNSERILDLSCAIRLVLTGTSYYLTFKLIKHRPRVRNCARVSLWRRSGASVRLFITRCSVSRMYRTGNDVSAVIYYCAYGMHGLLQGLDIVGTNESLAASFSDSGYNIYGELSIRLLHQEHIRLVDRGEDRRTRAIRPGLIIPSEIHPSQIFDV
jgi:hypothetical protein